MYRLFALGIVLACAALMGSTARAQEYSCDFSSSTGRAIAYGTASIDSGSLRLCQGIPNQNGSLILNTYAERATCFDATFNYTFNAAFPPFNLSMGLSFNLGILPDGVINPFAEIGPGNGLTVNFQLYDFDGNGIGGDCGIRVFYDGAVIASVPGAIDGPADNHQSRPVHIFLDYSGALTITYNGNPVVTNLATGFVPQPGQRFGFGARTPSWDSGEHRISNVVVRPYYAQPSCSNAAPISGDGIWGYSYDTPGSPTEGSACVPTSRDVWFCWQTPVSGMATISTVGLTDDDSVLTVYDGCYPCASGFGEMACNDDVDPIHGIATSRVTVPVKAGGTYGIRIALYNFNPNASGLEGMSITTQPDSIPCPADFNRDGAKTIQDIFDFLSAWFAPCP